MSLFEFMKTLTKNGCRVFLENKIFFIFNTFNKKIYKIIYQRKILYTISGCCGECVFFEKKCIISESSRRESSRRVSVCGRIVCEWGVVGVRV